MMTSDERKQILEMLAAGKLNVDEATRLLEAVETSAGAPASTTPGGAGVSLGKGRTLRVRVVENGKQKVNINVPFGLAKLFLGIAGKQALNHAQVRDLDVDEVIRQVESGVTGRIVEVNDGDKLVEIYVE